MKNTIIALIVLLLIGGGLYFYIQSTAGPASIELGDEPAVAEPSDEVLDSDPAPAARGGVPESLRMAHSRAELWQAPPE